MAVLAEIDSADESVPREQLVGAGERGGADPAALGDGLDWDLGAEINKTECPGCLAYEALIARL